MAQPRTSAPAIHAPDCDIWKIPDVSLPDALLGEGYEDQSVVAYLSEISPIYSALSRILAQFSGLLLLSMNSGRPILSLDHSMYGTACDQLCEVDERLSSIKTVPLSEKHFQAMQEIAMQLHGVAKNMDNLSETNGEEARKTVIMEIVRKLYSVQSLLVATAVPEANITPVDFRNACCSCVSTNSPKNVK